MEYRQGDNDNNNTALRLQSKMRLVMALNNAGVSLLEKGQMNKALHIFKTVASSWAAAAQSNCSEDPSRLPRALQEAQATVACCNTAAAAGAQHGDKKSSPKSRNNNIMEVRVVDDDDESSKHAARLLASSSSICFPLRLRDNPTGGDTIVNVTETIYVTAVILYNFGLAARCFFANRMNASSHPSANNNINGNGVKYLRGAAQTLRAAKTLLNERYMQKEFFDFSDLYRWDQALELVDSSLQRVLDDLRLLIASTSMTIPNQDVLRNEDQQVPFHSEVVDFVGLTFRHVQESASAA